VQTYREKADDFLVISFADELLTVSTVYTMMMPQSNPHRRYARKRSLAVVGLLIPVIQATPFAQHRVRPTSRSVPYQTSRIPSELVKSRDDEESKTQSEVDDEFSLETVWHVHADAINEHPDRVFEELRHGAAAVKNVSSNKAVNERSALSLFLRGLFQTDQNTSSSTADGSFVDTNETTSTAASVGFNVSVSTEYGVHFVGNATSTANDSSTVVFTTSNSTTNSTDADSSMNNSTENDSRTASFRPLRMRAFLSEVAGGGQHLSIVQRSLLLQNIIKPALLSWSAALRVEPVVGNLTVDPHQLVDGVSCGPGGELPSVVVPTAHLTMGVADTDFVLYISLAFATNSSNATADLDVTIENSTSVIEGVENINNDTQFFGSNDTNAIQDYIPKQECSGDYLAASAFCSTDQYDRPTAAILHICIGDDFFAEANVPTNIMIVMHELGHALGFNAVSLAHFRRPDGSPYTKRDPETGEIPITEINCTGPVGQRQTGKVALPSHELLQFRTVRGGVWVAEVVAPSVRQVARNHFDCQELPGAELESGEFLPLSMKPGEVACIGDHWERRLFKTDLMNPLVDDNLEFNPRFSSITLAYFADSGWYQVDLSRASLAAGWGRAAGCDFVEETCIQASDGQVPSKFNSFFCNQAPSEEAGFSSDIQGCTPDLSRKASCSLGRYEGELPPEYQYFNFVYGADVGGNDPFMDYCPVYAGFANGLCSDPENEALIGVTLMERFGQRNSRCLSGQVTRTSASMNDVSTTNTLESTSFNTEATALCLPIACVVEDRSLRIQVDGVWEICHKEGDIIVPKKTSFVTRNAAVSDSIFSITCPDPIRICPTFYCNLDCLGTNRICDYDVGRCVCNFTKANDNYNGWNETNFADIESLDDVDHGICNVPNGSEGGDASNAGSFFKPEIEDESGLPSPDSPLADYYVPTARNLAVENRGFWTERTKGIVSGSGAVVCLVFAVLCYMIMRQRHHSGQTSGDGAGDSPSGVDEINPDKHKLMASIVVNLRVNDPYLQRRADALGNRDSETDLSMTDTEGTSDVPYFQEFSLRPPTDDLTCGTIADLFGCRDDDIVSRLGKDDDNGYIDPLAPPAFTAPVVRRRHIFSNAFN
jgi:Leishmanolysin